MSEVFDFNQVANLEMRTFLGRYLTTGNGFLDMLLGFFAFRAILKLSEVQQLLAWSTWYHTIRRLLLSERPPYRGKLLFPWRQKGSGLNRTELSNDLSIEYKALVYRLNQLKDDRVHRVRECRLRYSMPVHHDDGGDGSDSMEELIYECTQQEPVEVAPGVHLEMNENEHEQQLKGGGTVQIQTRELSLQSNKYSPKQLVDLVDGWVTEYETDQVAKRTKSQMVFQVHFDARGKDTINGTPFHTFRSFDNYFFEHRKQVIDELNFFERQKAWYQARGLPHTLGILCYGEPGCGKTSLIKAVLTKTKRHAVVFSINKYTNLTEVAKLMTSDFIDDCVIPQDRRVYVFEDIDAMGDIVKKREDWENDESWAKKKKKKAKKEEEERKRKAKEAEAEGDGVHLMNGPMRIPFGGLLDSENQLYDLFEQLGGKGAGVDGGRGGGTGLNQNQRGGKDDDLQLAHILALLAPPSKLAKPNQNLSFFLNLLDGVVEAPGRIIIMTTNHVRKLDPALIRPGRIDLRLRFRRCSIEQMKQILSHFYDQPMSALTFPSWVCDGLITPARLGQICRGNKRSFEEGMKDLYVALEEEYKKCTVETINH